MFSLLSSFKRMLSYFFNRDVALHTNALPDIKSKAFPVLLPPLPTAPLLPDYEFRPSDGLLEAMGDGVVFVVANPLDLALQSQNLMSSVLVVEVKGLDPTLSSNMLWFRYDSFALSTRGVSICRLFAECDQTEIISVPSSERPSALGVCGWVVDRKRM